MNLKKTLATIVLGAALLPGCGSGPKPTPSMTQTAVLENDVNIRYNATLTNTTSATREKYHDNTLVETIPIDISNYMQILTDNEKGIHRFDLKATGAITQTNTVVVPNYAPENICSNDPITLPDKYDSQLNLDLEGCLTDKNPEDRPVNVTGIEIITGNLLLDHVGNLALVKAVENTEGESTFRVNYENANGDTGSDVFTVNTEKIPYQMAFWRAGTNSSTSHIYSANIDGTEKKQLTTDPNLDLDPNYSPEGHMLSNTTNRRGKLEVFLMNADGTNEQPLVTNLENVYSGAWSPDGEKMAVGYIDSGKTGIAVIDFTSGLVTKLFEDTYLNLPNSEAGSPKWFDNKIIFEKYLNGNWEIFEMDAIQGATQVNLTNNPSFHAAYSPDGKSIVFSRGDSNESDLYILDRITGNFGGLTNMPGIESDSDWFLDNILFTGKETGIFQLYIIKQDGTGFTQITSNPNEQNASSVFRPNNPDIIIP